MGRAKGLGEEVLGEEVMERARAKRWPPQRPFAAKRDAPTAEAKPPGLACPSCAKVIPYEPSHVFKDFDMVNCAVCGYEFLLDISGEFERKIEAVAGRLPDSTEAEERRSS